ncbi:MAG: protoporphyrinogen oxidase, partial [Acidimicrobiia bacterium]|nr:protoporphyrinogen oxidase [Acidimicrobiia bacterium]
MAGPDSRPHVVVVGGGISGLATALALADAAGETVTVEVREAGDRVGGKLHTSPFAGLPAVDEGADAFLARVPEATALAARVGLGDALTSPTGATAAVWYGRLHPIPDGLLLGVPTDMVRLAGSGLLSWRGKGRAAIEPFLPRRSGGSVGADSIGALVRGRFGGEVHERLVDALVGSIYGADTDRFSLAMVPQLAALASEHRSLLVGARRLRARTPGTPGPLFLAPSGGMGHL